MVDSHRITDLDNPMRPLALIEVNPVEGNYELWPTANRIRQYMDYELGKPENGGLTLEQFLGLPRQWVEFMIQERRERMEKIEQIRQREEAKQRQATLSENYGMGPNKS